jgi:hypothetical protein
MGHCKARCSKLKLKNSKGRKASESPFLPLLANTRAENSKGREQYQHSYFPVYRSSFRYVILKEESEEESEHEAGEADIPERENLETSEISIDDHGTLTLAVEALVAAWERRPPRAGAGDRTFTVSDRTREELLQDRKYFGTRTRRNNLFVVTVHSFIELFLQVEKPPDEAIVKAEIKPPGQRHPHVWAQESRQADAGSRLAFRVTYSRDAVETSLYMTSNLVRDLYKANSFVH